MRGTARASSSRLHTLVWTPIRRGTVAARRGRPGGMGRASPFWSPPPAADRGRPAAVAAPLVVRPPRRPEAPRPVVAQRRGCRRARRVAISDGARGRGAAKAARNESEGRSEGGGVTRDGAKGEARASGGGGKRKRNCLGTNRSDRGSREAAGPSTDAWWGVAGNRSRGEISPPPAQARRLARLRLDLPPGVQPASSPPASARRRSLSTRSRRDSVASRRSRCASAAPPSSNEPPRSAKPAPESASVVRESARCARARSSGSQHCAVEGGDGRQSVGSEAARSRGRAPPAAARRPAPRFPFSPSPP